LVDRCYCPLGCFCGYLFLRSPLSIERSA
jgi:hypothetical protein